MSHIIVRIDVVRDSRFVGTGMKNFDVSLSSLGRTFGDGSGAEAGESKMRQAWNSALRYYIRERHETDLTRRGRRYAYYCS